MPEFKKSSLIRRSGIALFALALTACEVGSSTAPRSPYRAPSAGNSGANAGASSAEVGTSIPVTVTVKDKSGYGIKGVTPSISAIAQSTGLRTGVSSGGCSSTDVNGVANCTLSATLPDAYVIMILSPVSQSTTSRVTFVQYARSIQFVTQPAAVTAAASFAASTPSIKVLDRVGNQITSYTSGTSRTLAIALTSPGTATLSGTTAVKVSGGTGTWGAGTDTALSVDKAGSYTLTATLTDATTGQLTATSSSFTVTAGAAYKLLFTTSPSDTAVNVNFSPQPVVAVTDMGGNVVTTGSYASCPVTVNLDNVVAPDALVGTLTVTAQSGVADFKSAALRVASTAARAHTLTATTTCTSGGVALRSATSTSFTSTLSGTPDHIAITTAPSGASLNVAWPTQPVVQILDSSGALVSDDNETVVTVAIRPGGPGGTLAGATSMMVTNGVAAFSGLQTNGTAANAGTYTLRFSAANPDYTAVASVPIDVTQSVNSHGVTPAKLSFKVQPANVAVNQAEANLQAQVLDSSGYPCVNDNSSSVLLRVSTGPGALVQNGSPVGSVLGTASGGVVTFTGVALDSQGNYTLKLDGTSGTGAILTTGYSNSFAVAAFGAADHLHFYRQPAAPGSTAGTPWATQPQVEVLDVQGNRVTSDNSSVVTLTCGTGSSACGTLVGTVSGSAVNGLVDYTGHGIRTSNTSTNIKDIYIHAANDKLIGADSSSFTENPGGALPATSMSFTTQPADVGPYTCRGWSTQPVIKLIDVNGNVASSDSSSQVTLSCAAGCTGLVGQTTVTVVNGVANFANAGLYAVDDNCAGAGVTGIKLHATTTASGVAAINSNVFTGN